jgi:hypothetical protein
MESLILGCDLRVLVYVVVASKDPYLVATLTLGVAVLLARRRGAGWP